MSSTASSAANSAANCATNCAARVSVIIPAWNLWDMTAACLRSLAEHTRHENIEVVVVDNGSTDATATELEPLGRALFGADFRPVRLPENQGFARGCNAGAAASQGDLLFFLNNDTTMTPDWLPPLRQALEQPRVGAVGPLLLYPNGTVQHCGIYFTPFMAVGHLYEGFPGGHAAPRKRRPLQAITGAALLLRKSVFMDCGGFYEEYCNGFEDMDLCCALRARGYKLAVEGGSVIVHHTSQTPGRFDHNTFNGELLMRRHGGSLKPDLHTLVALDGYELAMGPDLDVWPVLPDAQEERRNRDFDALSASEETCRLMLEQEPLWRGGWYRLMDMLEAGGNAREALHCAVRCAMFFGDAVSRQRLLALTARVEGTDSAASLSAVMKTDAFGTQAGASAGHSADTIAGQSAEPGAQTARTPAESGGMAGGIADITKIKVQQARRAAYARGDGMLAGILNQWLMRYGRP
ncbi:MAG: glycosyltransferase family 2 protein [Desulfovibrio sp.]|uniref:glycosyltransferase family 2 protein n=1 Tax=Desulfovibrio sp. TaxID=885 RepID=UPI002A364163|nr:glycosyltransferase family 2 protein [Desulfovibrio sp.]MDY0260310.1 glycosyltransferase family 2 protein [Desulfovibrio sp.]